MFRKTAALFLPLGIALLPALAHGALGRTADSTDADQKMLQARKSVRPGAAFTVHELELPSGTQVREYVNADGLVFAVAWRGSTLPDLKQIFGEDHFQAFLAASPAQHTPHKSRAVREPGLVARSSGSARFFSGLAYVPSLMPPTVREEDIR
jgi:hypothetical protein